MKIRRIATVAAMTASFLLLAAQPASAKPQANFRVTEVSSPPATIAPGASFQATGELRNNGKAAGRARVSLELRGQGPDVELGSVRVRVPAKSEKPFSAQATVPSDTPAGNYTFRACVPKQGKKGKDRCRNGGEVTVSGPPKQYTPGARTLGDPLFPQTGNGGYDAQSYDIEIDYDPATNLFGSASTTIEAVATQDLSEFSLDFQDQLDVSSVTINGTTASFAFAATPQLGDDPEITQLTKLVVTPAAGIPSGSEFEVVVNYDGEPQLMTDTDFSVEGWIPACRNPGPVCDGAFVVNQPNGAQTWFPGNNYPTDKATFNTSITVPESHVAFGIGELGSRSSNGDGTWTWSWEEDDPTSTYLTTATVGLFDYETNAVFEDSTSRVLPFYGGIDSSYTTAAKANISGTQSLTSEMLNFLSELYRPYPLDSIGSIVDRASGVGYALEVQTKPAYAAASSQGTPSDPDDDDISESTQLHEIAHMWFGNTITLEEWTDIWFNEGFATWSEWRFDEENGGATTAETFTEYYENDMFVDLDDYPEPWALAPAILDGDPANLFTYPTYDRGAMVIEGTRQILGAEGFDEFVQELFARFAYENISTQEFIALAKEVSGFSGAQLDLLDDFYEQWLYGEVKPTILPEDFPPVP